jgi:hypothetical protein
MTDDELIQKAIEQLKRNKVEKGMLESPLVHDAAVVYFKIRSGSNISYVMMVLDRQTGEQLNATFGPNPFLKQGFVNSQ